MSWRVAFIVRLSLLFSFFALFPNPIYARPPAGQSALLNGMHDIESASWMAKATSGCDKGWLTDLRYIGTQSLPGVSCHQSATKAGISIVQRLDVSGTESYPRYRNRVAGYAKNFAHYAKSCANIHVWIVGNEPNFTEHKSDPDCTSAAYARAYVAVHKAVHALPGHQQDLVLVASNSPYSPGCIQSLRQIIQEIKKAGVTPDGFALHAYTQAGSGSQLNKSFVTNTRLQNDQTRKECSGNAKWNDTWHWHFRIYQDYIRVIEKAGLAGKAVLITESGNACQAKKGNACYPNADIGYFQALYAEAHRWNQLSTTKTKIRAITPYRWTRNDDGTGRDFAIGQRPKLLTDLKKAFGQKYSWTSSACGSTGCRQDADCNVGERCDIAKGRCEPRVSCRQDKDCGATERCDIQTGRCLPKTSCRSPKDCPGQVCRPSTCPSNQGRCEAKGAGAFQWASPPTNKAFTVQFQHPTGWGHVGLFYCGPRQGQAKYLRVKKVGKNYVWTYQFPALPNGLYQLTFTADKGSTTVGRTNMMLGPPPCQPSPERCNGKDDDCDGKIDNTPHQSTPLTRSCYEGDPKTKDTGICRAGSQQCTQGRWQACQQQVLPRAEICNNLDDDCDGRIDQGCRSGSEKAIDAGTQPSPDRDTAEERTALIDTGQAREASRPVPTEAGGVIRVTPAQDQDQRGSRRGCGCHSYSFSHTTWWLGLFFLLMALRLFGRVSSR